MIIAEHQVKVPSRKYKLSIICTKTRRLTAIEWLILSCVQKFHESNDMSSKTLKDVFERVFDLQDSSLLIKPSVENLKKLGVLNFFGNGFDYNTTAFQSIELTDIGRKMLSDGLLPGETTRFNREVWYNPLTGQLNSQEIPRSNPNEIAVFGKREDYGTFFPEEEIKRKLQAGELGSEKFSASEYIIDSIENKETLDSETFVTLVYDVDKDDRLTVTPDIIEEGMKRKVDEFLFCKGITKKSLQSFIPISKANIETVYGSGLRISDALVDVCRNGRILFVNGEFLDLISGISSQLLSGKMVVVFNSGKLGSKVENESLMITIPSDFEIPGCVVINDRNDSVSLQKDVLEYDGRRIEYPLAIRDGRIRSRGENAIQWLEKEALKNGKRDIAYYGLFATPVLRAKSDALFEALSSLWRGKALDAILSDILRMSAISKGLFQDPIDLTPLLGLLVEKINNRNADRGLSDYQRIIQSAGIIKGSDLHYSLVEKAMSIAAKPNCYSDLRLLQEKLGVVSHEVALRFDEFFDPLYSEEVIRDILQSIINGKNPIKDELFAADEYFSTYVDNLDHIALLIGRQRSDLFKPIDSLSLGKAVMNCPDTALLQAYVAELTSSNAELLERNINIYSLMLDIDKAKADYFFNSLNLIERYLVDKIKGIIPVDLEPVSKKKSKEDPVKIEERVFILDTCAIINNPDLFLYFSENEYIRLPLTVIDELGRIKDRRSSFWRDQEASTTARHLAKDIKEVYLKVFNVMNECIFMTAKADLDLLPPDLDPSTPDNMILSIAIKYKDWNLCLITDDVQFSLVAKECGINTTTSSVFIETHKKYYCERWKIKEKYEKSDMPSSSVYDWLVRNAEIDASKGQPN